MCKVSKEREGRKPVDSEIQDIVLAIGFISGVLECIRMGGVDMVDALSEISSKAMLINLSASNAIKNLEEDFE